MTFYEFATLSHYLPIYYFLAQEYPRKQQMGFGDNIAFAWFRATNLYATPVLLSAETETLLFCGKGNFLYDAVSILQDCSKRFTLSSLANLFNMNTIPDSLKACASYFIHKHPPLAISRYSFIQLSELGQFRMKTCPRFYVARRV